MTVLKLSDFEFLLVNGSSHTNLTPLWAEILGKSTLKAKMLSKVISKHVFIPQFWLLTNSHKYAIQLYVN